MKFPDKRSSSEEGSGPREKQRVSQPETEKEQIREVEGRLEEAKVVEAQGKRGFGKESVHSA